VDDVDNLNMLSITHDKLLGEFRKLPFPHICFISETSIWFVPYRWQQCIYILFENTA